MIDNVVYNDEVGIFSAYTSFCERLVGFYSALEEFLENMKNSKFISMVENSQLLQIISEEEIEWAVPKSDHRLAPGPDGFPMPFFHKPWNVIKVDLSRATRDFFENGRLVRSINQTHLVTIPKIQSNSQI